MKIKFLFFAVALSLGFASCSQDENLDAGQGTDRVMISTRISQMGTPQTRTIIADDGKGTFEEQDRISLFVTDNGTTTDHTLTLQNNEWTPALSWTDYTSEQVAFTAFHPVLASADANQVFTTRLDQNAAGNYEASDFLMASARVDRLQNVRLDFKHAMSLVEFNLTANEVFTPEQLASATLTMQAYNQIKFNAHTATLSSPLGAMEQITFKNMGGGKFRAIVCPQGITAAHHNDCWVEISIGGKTLKYKAPASLNNGAAFNKLQSGMQVTFNITISKDEGGNPEPGDNWANQTVWVYGINNPPLDQWGYYNTYPNKIIGLQWQRQYGWYDVNKHDPHTPAKDDKNMCWAASCSNIILWWLDRNKENVARYGYTGPQTYENSLKCDVFEFFKEYFPDRGVYTSSGLCWFFNGSPVTAEDAQPVKPHSGFFSDVLTDNKTIFRTGTGRSLDEDVKQALTSQEVIGLEIAGRFGAHAITCWGADFDKDGKICALYIAENNDRDSEQQGYDPMRPQTLCPVGIYPVSVKIVDGAYALDTSGTGNYNIFLQSVVYVGHNAAQWDAYFAANPTK